MQSTTDPQEELLPIVNEKDEVIGKITRKEANQSPNIIHRAAGVFVFNSKGQLLIQKRSKTKDTFPSCWDISVGGHVEYKDDYQNTSTRELFEELGIKVKPENLTLLGKLLVILPWEKEYWQIYQYNLLNNIYLSFNKDETSETQFVSIADLKEMLSDPNIQWSNKARQQFNQILFKK